MDQYLATRRSPRSAYHRLSARAKRMLWLERLPRPATCRCLVCGIQVVRSQLADHRQLRCPGKWIVTAPRVDVVSAARAREPTSL